MAMTSPLTSFTTLSTPESYAAQSSPHNETDEMALSSSIDGSLPSLQYRTAAQIPHELKQHCQIHLESELFLPALQILEGLLSDGITLPSDPESAPTRVAPPSQLALLGTLLIHPAHTSRPPSGTQSLHTAARALAYLRGVLNIAGPVNANLRAAFKFRSSSGRAGRDRDRAGIYGSACSSRSCSDSGSESDYINYKLAKEQSLWRRAPDFWAVLGWTFRCAAAHPHRWRHWRVWLEFMVEVLEADWDQRLKMDDEQCDSRGGSGSQNCGGTPEGRDYKMVRESLLVEYLDDLRRERKNPLREVMRALMAFTDDDPADKNVYREVFDKESLTGPRNSKRKRTPTVVDLEKDQFGDYLDWGDDDGLDEEDEDVEAGLLSSLPTPARRAGQPRKITSKLDTPSFRVSDGITDSVPLRQRIFRLLSAAANFIPEHFCKVHELYGSFSTRIRSLPLPMFRLFVESHTTTLPDFAQVTLLRQLTEELLPNSSGGANRSCPAVVNPEINAKGGISLDIMEQCYLPFPASRVTAEENAKLSLALESMLWFIFANREFECTSTLSRAIEKGIRAREDKIKKRVGSERWCKGDGGSGAAGADAVAREALDRSARSLRVFTKMKGC
ncbi:hypothetical protein B0T25DRAFT_498998 [Lasiosphaeria hispida]|uniref:Uncharacterized protein n=1 Tax=Lasiosphaeria hispida TaxID=260671 RepID=A0AAJ0MG99_9PEZI|nr:hypothetical protein B0T25DRAFT_498998 [Lasiosphaeria hispida]